MLFDCTAWVLKDKSHKKIKKISCLTLLTCLRDPFGQWLRRSCALVCGAACVYSRYSLSFSWWMACLDHVTFHVTTTIIVWKVLAKQNISLNSKIMRWSIDIPAQNTYQSLWQVSTSVFVVFGQNVWVKSGLILIRNKRFNNMQIMPLNVSWIKFSLRSKMLKKTDNRSEMKPASKRT